MIRDGVLMQQGDAAGIVLAEAHKQAFEKAAVQLAKKLLAAAEEKALDRHAANLSKR